MLATVGDSRRGEGKAALQCGGSEHTPPVGQVLEKCREGGKIGILHRNRCSDCTQRSLESLLLRASRQNTGRGGCRALSFTFHYCLPSFQSKTPTGIKCKDLVLLLQRAAPRLAVAVAVTQSWLTLSGVAPVQQEALRPCVPGEKGFCRAYS